MIRSESTLRLLILAMCLMGWLGARAVPASPMPRTITQPDGGTVTVQLVGDEFYSYHRTSDGYTLLRDDRGAFTYATLRNGRLASSGIIAHDAAGRTREELDLLAATPQRLTDREAIAEAKRQRSKRDLQPRKAEQFNYDAFRGLVVLVNFTDVQFSMDNPAQFYDEMCNADNYTGFTYEGKTYDCAGSMRDYFRDNSMGKFQPHFDVVGPVTVNMKSTDIKKHDNAWRAFKEALDKLDSTVDFSQYDTDGDEGIDMIYFIVAGYTAEYSGNNQDLLWSHKSGLFDHDSWTYLNYDGVYPWLYACSGEMYGWENRNRQPTGIGTMTHEFSHVLGLPDLYDTDYEENGQSRYPGDWDVMSGGSYFNETRTPVGYTIFERYALGFASPTVITSPGQYTLNPIDSSNEGYILPSPVKNEFFMFDNRQKRKWDAYLPGHGMLAVRVDSTNVSVWEDNIINANPDHTYYELLRAGGDTGGDSPSDPFPGSAAVTRISNSGYPSLLTWNGTANEFEITDIAEDAQGVITFTVRDPNGYMTTIEDFEEMPVTTEVKSENQRGRWAKWSFTNCNVMAPGSDFCDDKQAVGMYAPSLMQMTTDVDGDLNRVSAHIINKSSATAAKFKLYYSIDQGTTWQECPGSLVTVDGNSDITATWNIAINQPVRFRLNMTGGSKSKSARVYIDNLTLRHADELRSTYDPTEPDPDPVLATDVTLDRATLKLLPDETAKLTATVSPNDVTNGKVTWTSSDTDIATVDNEGVVTAIALGEAIITATTTDGTELTATCLLTVATTKINEFSIDSISVYRGEDFDLVINLNNESDVVKFEIDLFLPEGISFTLDDNGEPVVTLNADRAVNHKIVCSEYDNDFNVVAYSLSNVPFIGNEGAICTIRLTADERMAAKDYLISLYIDSLYGPNGKLTIQDDIVETVITVQAHAKEAGDVNGDGVVNATDIAAIVNVIAGIEDNAQYDGRADVNGDNSVNATDIAAIVNIIAGLQQ